MGCVQLFLKTGLKNYNNIPFYTQLNYNTYNLIFCFVLFCFVLFSRGNLSTQQPGYNNQQSLLETYIEIGKEFYSIYKVANWVDNIATNNESVNYFLSKVNPNRSKRN